MISDFKPLSGASSWHLSTAAVKVGAYHYSYALNVEDAIREAANCCEAIESAGVLLEQPVFFDMEDVDGYKQRNGFAFDPAEITSMCQAFIDNVGLDCGVYASYSWMAIILIGSHLGVPFGMPNGEKPMILKAICGSLQTASKLAASNSMGTFYMNNDRSHRRKSLRWSS